MLVHLLSLDEQLGPAAVSRQLLPLAHLQELDVAAQPPKSGRQLRTTVRSRPNLAPAMAPLMVEL